MHRLQMYQAALPLKWSGKHILATFCLTSIGSCCMLEYHTKCLIQDASDHVLQHTFLHAYETSVQVCCILYDRRLYLHMRTANRKSLKQRSLTLQARTR